MKIKGFKSAFRRVLSVCLSVLMLLSAWVFVSPSAGATLTVSGELPTFTFYVPETIYLKPSDNKTFQYYVDWDANGSSLRAGNANTTGYIYFSCSSATAVTGLTCGGATASLSATTSSNGTLKSTINSGALSAAIAMNATTLVSWTITFTTASGNYTATAYSVAYAPNRNVTANGATGFDYNSKEAFASSLIYIQGAQTTGTGNWTGESSSDHRTLYQNVSGTKLDPLVNGIGTPNNNNPHDYGSSSSTFTGATNSFTTCYCVRKDNYDGDGDWVLHVECNRTPAEVIVDTSRYNNTSQIPNLKLRFIVTDRAAKDGDTDKRRNAYVADCTGQVSNPNSLSSATMNYTAKYDGSNTTVDLLKHSRWREDDFSKGAYSKAGTVLWGDTGTDDNVTSIGEKYNAAINYAVSGSGATTYRYFRGGACGNKNDSWPMSTVLVILKVTTVNKSSLRSLVNSCVGTYMQPYYTSDTWNTYNGKLQNACTVLGNPKATATEISSAASELTSAKNALVRATGTVTVSHKSSTGKTLATETMDYSYGQNVAVESNTYTGYTFTSSDPASLTANIVTSASQNWTLTYTPITYNLSYVLDSDETLSDDLRAKMPYNTSNPATYNVESSAITLYNPIKKAHTFKGWSGTDLNGDENTTVTIPAASIGDRSFTANWTLNEYNVTYGSHTTGTVSKVDGLAQVTTTVSADDSYHLTDAVNVSVGALPLTRNTQFTFALSKDKKSAEITINEDLIANDVTVTVTAEACSGTPPTCARRGFCSICDGEYGVIDNSAHNYVTERVDAKYLKTAATCSSYAVYYYACANGCETLNTSVGTWTNDSAGYDNTNHDFTGAIKSDGNGENATHSFRCTYGCGNYGGAVTHTWNSGTVTKEATCVTDGVRTYTCTASGCGATYTWVIPATGVHTYTGTPVWGDWTDENTVSATVKCRNCESTISPQITVTPVYTQPTCNENGFTTYTARLTNNNVTYTNPQTKVVYDDPSTQLTHSFTNYVYNNDATCTADGTETAACDHGCGAMDTRTATGTMLDHTFTVRVYDDTHHWMKCENCSAITDTEAHTGGEATCTAQAVCTVCEQPYGALLPHNYSKKEFDETNHWMQCADCGAIDQTTVQAHTFSVPQYDETDHWYQCSDCDALTEKEAHFGGAATCAAKAQCDVCSQPYGETLPHGFTSMAYDADTHWLECANCHEKDNTSVEPHVYDTQGFDGANHWMQCGVCGAVDASTVESHDFSVSQKDENEHWQKCSLCDATSEKVAHSFTVMQENETHHWYKCEGCDATGAKTTHLFTKQNNDETYHWIECVTCARKTNLAEHDFSVIKSDETRHWKKCAGCAMTKDETLHDFSVLQNDADNHWTKCSGCDEIINLQAHAFTVPEKDATYHWTKCSGCAAIKHKQIHTYSVAQKDADYHWSKCSGCDTITEKTAHSFSVSQYNATQHWNKCEGCDEITEKAAHTGGTATCLSKAVCTVCKQAYGEKSDHVFSVLQTDATGHWYKCENCNTMQQKQMHTGGEATCSEQAVCDVCGKSYGSLPAHDYTVPQHDAEYHWNNCRFCGAAGEKTAHFGGTATCTEQAQCEVCETSYGALALHVAGTQPQSGANTHWFLCVNCGAKVNEAAHSGGTATCTALAQCAVCAAPYGGFDYNNHATAETVLLGAKESGYTFEGKNADVCCALCEHVITPGDTIDKLDINDHPTYSAAKTTQAEGAADPTLYVADDLAELNAKIGELDAALAVDNNEEAVLQLIGELLTALGKIKSCQVTFLVDGVVVDEQSVPLTGDAQAPDTVPEYQTVNVSVHKRFSGWNQSLNTVCNDLEISAEYEETPHDWVIAATVQTATCMTAGRLRQNCVCGQEREIDTTKNPSNHTGNNTESEENRVEPTCTKEGGYDVVTRCECGAALSSEHHVIAKTPHTFGVYVYNNDATCERDGTQTARCTNGCGMTDTKTMPNTQCDHNWGKWVPKTPATCAHEGVLVRSCSFNPEHTEEKSMPMIDHVDMDGDGCCEVCGALLGSHRHYDDNHDNLCDECGETIDKSFRCSLCARYAQMLASGESGITMFFFSLLHMIVHSVQSLGTV